MRVKKLLIQIKSFHSDSVRDRHRPRMNSYYQYPYPYPRLASASKNIKYSSPSRGKRLICYSLYSGKRLCLGEVLARATFFTYFTTLLQNYTFERSPGHGELNLVPRFGLTLSPAPFHSIVKQR
jgi:cytochrome P450